MKFNEYDTVRTLNDCGEGIKKGDVGVVLVRFEEPHEAYEVEFVDSKGQPKAQCTLLPHELEKAE